MAGINQRFATLTQVDAKVMMRWFSALLQTSSQHTIDRPHLRAYNGLACDHHPRGLLCIEELYSRDYKNDLLFKYLMHESKMKKNFENIQTTVVGLYLAIVGTGITFAITTFYHSSDNKVLSTYEMLSVGTYLVFGYIPTVLRFSLGTANLLSNRDNKSGFYLLLLTFWFLLTAVLFLLSLVFYLNKIPQHFYFILFFAFIIDFLILILPERSKNKLEFFSKIIYFWNVPRPLYIQQWIKSTLILIFITIISFFLYSFIPIWVMTLTLALASFCDFYYNQKYYLGEGCMKRVIVESPFKGNQEENKKFLHECLKHCLAMGESPYASHGFFTHFLDDDNEKERALGIEAGLVWNEVAEAVIVYVDRGISSGMEYGIKNAASKNIPIFLRRLSSGAEIPYDAQKSLPDQVNNL